MPIKTQVKNTVVEPKQISWRKVKYPCIGIARNGEVVLFSAFEHGVTIVDSGIKDCNKVGHYSDSWISKNFDIAPSSKQFILSNV